MDVNRDSTNDATDSSITSQRTAAPARASFSGLAVTATTLDDIEVYTFSLTAGFGTISAAAGVNTLENLTLATIGTGAQVNQTVTNSTAAQSVLVAAGHDVNQTAIGGTAAIGAGAAPTAGITVIRETTLAQVASSANVRRTMMC